ELSCREELLTLLLSLLPLVWKIPVREEKIPDIGQSEVLPNNLRQNLSDLLNAILKIRISLDGKAFMAGVKTEMLASGEHPEECFLGSASMGGVKTILTGFANILTESNPCYK
ncbi:lysosomal-trafficking regulator isoform X1, partial [Clarias magur]